MPTTAQMLADYPDVLLEVIAELRNAEIVAGAGRAASIDRLAEEITNPTSVQFAYQEAVDTDPRCEEAVDALLAAGGELAEADFSRDFGSIRQMGPGKMERETPWLYPQGTAEVLYYLGLLGMGFSGAGKDARSIVYLPNDAAPWLPRPQAQAALGGLAVQPAPPPPRARIIPADDSFLEDAGTLIGFVNSDQLHLSAGAPNVADIDRLVQRLQFPIDDASPEQNARLALLLHLANKLRWLRLADGGLVQLAGNRVRAFLDQTRAEQRQTLFEAWRDTSDWDDLCRIPAIECVSAVNADPGRTRAAVLALLGKLQPSGWYRVPEIIAAIKQSDPEFQRSLAQFDLWELRHSTTQESLKGFEHWDDVEGELLRFLLLNPLHWLGAVDLAEPSAGDEWLVSLTNWGARWLGMDVVQPYEPAHRSMQVREDFMVELPLGTPLGDRFRVERFTQWQSSYPSHVFQINQRSLKRSQEMGIKADQILDFLTSRTRVPDRVVAALKRHGREQEGTAEISTSETNETLRSNEATPTHMTRKGG